METMSIDLWYKIEKKIRKMLPKLAEQTDANMRHIPLLRLFYSQNPIVFDCLLVNEYVKHVKHSKVMEVE